SAAGAPLAVGLTLAIAPGVGSVVATLVGVDAAIATAGRPDAAGGTAPVVAGQDAVVALFTSLDQAVPAARVLARLGAAAGVGVVRALVALFETLGLAIATLRELAAVGTFGLSVARFSCVGHSVAATGHGAVGAAGTTLRVTVQLALVTRLSLIANPVAAGSFLAARAA